MPRLLAAIAVFISIVTAAPAFAAGGTMDPDGRQGPSPRTSALIDARL